MPRPPADQVPITEAIRYEEASRPAAPNRLINNNLIKIANLTT